jgi:hypothetical protein
MKIAPNAELDDGVFDITVVGDLGIMQLLTGFARQVYTGDHLKTKGVSVRRARVVEAEAINPKDEVEFDVDGEHLGRLPARFEVVPQALKVIVARADAERAAGAGAKRAAGAGAGASGGGAGAGASASGGADASAGAGAAGGGAGASGGAATAGRGGGPG